MNVRKRKCFRKFFGFIVFVLKLNFIFCSYNTTKIESDKYNLKDLSLKISDKLKQATYIQLGVTPMQKIYDSFEFTLTTHNVDKDIQKIAKKFEDKLTKTFNVLKEIKNSIENMQKSISTQIHFYQKFNNENFVNQNISDDHLMQMFSEKFLNSSFFGLKQIYFLSSVHVENKHYLPPTYHDFDDLYIWNLYTSLTKKASWNIIIALDLGSTFNSNTFNIAKSVAKTVIKMTDKMDKIGIIAFGYEWTSPYITGYTCQVSSQTNPLTTDECKLSNATSQNKIIFNTFIDTLSRINGSTTHKIIFQQLLKAVELNLDSNSNEPVMLLYITSNIYSSYSETANILNNIAKFISNFETRIIINIIHVKNENKDILYEHHFLSDISNMNFNKYNINFQKTNLQSIGLMHSINSSNGLSFIVARLFNTLEHKKVFDLKEGITLPTWQESTQDFVVSMYVPCGKNNFGILGLDIYFSNIVEDITYYNNQPKYSYAVLLTTNGLMLMHPSFSRPIVTKKQLKFVDISYFEKYNNFTLIRDSILLLKNGSKSMFEDNKMRTYIWHRVLNYYIVCVVIKEGIALQKRSRKTVLTDISAHYNFLHHRLDLLSPPSLCRHLNQISTLDAGTIYLSATCFQSPYSYLRGAAGLSVSSLTLQSYMAYIKDNTRLLANPGLKDGIRNDVIALSSMLKYLMQQHLQGFLYKYAVRRYIATTSGIMLMYPGAIFNVELEPTKRNWFIRALEHPGKIALTSPYLDAGGAGYIVTISHTITEKDTSDVIAVMAMDVTFGYIYKILLEIVPYCSKHETIKCFIIDDRGYLIYHPNLLEVNGKRPIEQQHIIHKESLIANDLLNHKEFVKKILCNNYADGTIQRYYKFNTSMNTVLSNLIHGEHCVKYFISTIPGTNVFMGIVNYTCTDVTTFCPCSTVNRLCLICNRVEQNECECPCECPLNFDNETCFQANNVNDNDLCSAVTENSAFVSNNIYYNIAAGLKPCFPSLCEIHTTYESCVGLIGCEWCHLDVDGKTKLQNSFCTALTMCFHGILGSGSPYRDIQLEAISTDDLFVSTYSSVGPAAGSIIALCFILALVFYCYRQYSLQFMERLYPNSTPNRIQTVQMSSINVDIFNDESTNHQDKLLVNFQKDMEPISPYCITTEYRKPSTAVDSDLGYSTMTPHEESERMSFALIEMDSYDDDCNTSDAVSTSTSIQGFKSKLDHIDRSLSEKESNITKLRNKHCILAPVTVHRNMETI